MYVVCLEHLERAIDEFVDEYEMPPDVHLLSDITFTEWTAPRPKLNLPLHFSHNSSNAFNRFCSIFLTLIFIF